jgi:predicted transcriptional regulator
MKLFKIIVSIQLPIDLLIKKVILLLVNSLEDNESKLILKLIESAKEPLETKEIEGKLKKVSRSKILYRLNNLRAEGLIKGKQIGSGKGTWIWWKNSAFV